MSVQISTNSTLNRIPKALVDRKVRDAAGKLRTEKVTVPVHQIQRLDHTDIYYTQSVKGCPQNLFRNSGTKFSATLEKAAFYKMESLTLKITLSNSSASPIPLVKLPYFFERIEFRSNNGSKNMNTIHNDNLYFSFAGKDQREMEGLAKAAGMKSGFTSAPNFSNEVKLGANSSITLYLPLICSWLDTADIWWKTIQGDLMVDLYPANNIVDAADRSANVSINLESIDFVIETELLTPNDELQQTNLYNSTSNHDYFLDITPVTFYNHKLFPNVQTKLELDSLNGDYAFLLVLIRTPGYTNVNAIDTALQFLGDDAKIDILDPGSRSVLGGGSALDLGYLNNIVLPSQFNNNFLQENSKLIVVPFGGSTQNTFQGVKDGSYVFNGERSYLALTPGSAFVAGEYEIMIYGYHYSLFARFANGTLSLQK